LALRISDTNQMSRLAYTSVCFHELQTGIRCCADAQWSV
jgi:hypothetical protein